MNSAQHCALSKWGGRKGRDELFARLGQLLHTEGKSQEVRETMSFLP